MQSSRKQSEITSQLEKLLNFAESFGFTTFAYDCSKRRVKHVKSRSNFFRLTLLSLQYTTCLIVNFVLGLSFYTHCIEIDYHSWKQTSSVVVQELFLVLLHLLMEYMCFGLLAKRLLEAHRLILPVINEMLKIYDALEKKTDPKLSVPRFFKYAITVRAVIMIYALCLDFAVNLVLCVILIGFIQIYGEFLTATALMAHLYSQLVLISFYSKMTEFLQVADLHMSKEEFSKNVQVLLTLSFRIHRVKTQLNTLSSGIFLTVFFGLSFAICMSYYGWKRIVFENEWGQNRLKLIAGCIWLCTSFFVIIYDLYLICWLSDELVARERRFMRSILLLICRNKLSNGAQVSWELNQILIQSEVFKLKSMLFRLIELDKPFVLNYFFYMVVQYIVVCMQFYIKERYRNKEYEETFLL